MYMYKILYILKHKTADEMATLLDFRLLLFRSTAAGRRQRLLERAPRRPAADPLLPFALVVGRIEQQGLIVLEHSERAPVVQRWTSQLQRSALDRREVLRIRGQLDVREGRDRRDGRGATIIHGRQESRTVRGHVIDAGGRGTLPHTDLGPERPLPGVERFDPHTRARSARRLPGDRDRAVLRRFGLHLPQGEVVVQDGRLAAL